MSKPRILIFDLETSPDPREIYKRIPSIGAWPGRTFSADLQSIICFGYKWLGESRARSINAWDFKPTWKRDRHDDSALLKEARKIVAQADGIITHNGKSFDLKVLKTRLMYHYQRAKTSKEREALAALPTIKHIDTKLVLKAHLKQYSNSLEETAKFLNCTPKMKFPGNKWGLWERIAFKQESKKDLQVMDKYCKQDVDTLDEIFQALRPYSKDIPNYAVFAGLEDEVICSSCGSTHVSKNGFHTLLTGLVQRYYCRDCGSHFRVDKKGKNPRNFV